MRDAGYIRDLLRQAGTTDFSYSHQDQSFTIGDREVGVEDAVSNPGLLIPDAEDKLSDGDPMLGVSLWRHVAYPGMYGWLNENFDKKMSEETIEVMIDAFAKANPDFPKQHLRADRGGFMGFSAERVRKEHPHISLSVLGNCACLYASVSGLIGEHDWESKFASYEMHNIDTPAQRVSILSGLGHLARRATEG